MKQTIVYIDGLDEEWKDVIVGDAIYQMKAFSRGDFVHRYRKWQQLRVVRQYLRAIYPVTDNSADELPFDADWLLSLFLSSERRECFIGDLEERYYRMMVGSKGHFPKFWYSLQIFISLRPIIWATILRISGWERFSEWKRRAR